MLEYNRQEPLFSIHIPKTAGTSITRVLAKWFNKRSFPDLRYHPRLAKVLMPLNHDLLLQRFLGCSLYLHYFHHHNRLAPRRIPLGKKYGPLLMQKRSECVHGHYEPAVDGGDLFHFYPNARQFCTVFRDPLEMEISMYNYHRTRMEGGVIYWKGKKITQMTEFKTLDQWLEERGSYMTHFLPWEIDENNYREIFEKNFVHIGIVEDLQRSMDIMADKLGKPSVKVPKLNLSKPFDRPSAHAVDTFRSKRMLDYKLYEFAVKLNA